jgi:hypothetical protein
VFQAKLGQALNDENNENISPISAVLQTYFQGYLPVPGRHVIVFLDPTGRVAGSTTPKPLTPIPWLFRNQMPRFFGP